MAFPPGFLDELRARVPLASLIGRRVKLTRRGREQIGLCPFHHEKTPSFCVVEDKAFFHCFGCGAHGDAIGFLMRADNLDFVEAVERLAQEAGLAVPQASREERATAQRQKTLLEAMAAAAAFYEAQLCGAGGGRARDYLAERGLDAETIRRFRLGWAPGGQALAKALAGSFPTALLTAAGLVRQSDGGRVSDYFRERVLFPIGDRAGRIIAFGGRVLGDGQPKYLNSPETPLFEKGRVLYGWAAARAALAREAGLGNAGASAIVTEGYMDVIALVRAGFAGAIAPLGTALTEAQIAELWRLSPEPILCFDGDEAGQRAAARALRRALPLLKPGRSLRFAALPVGEDPDSLLRSGGAEGFAEILAAARPLADVLWHLEAGLRPAETPERRADLRRRLDEAALLIEDREVREEYRAHLRDRFFAEFRHIGRNAAARTSPAARAAAPRAPRTAAAVQRAILLRLLLICPALIDEVAEELAALLIPEHDLDRLRHAILAAASSQPGLDAQGLRQHLLQHGFAVTVEALLAPSVDTGFLVRRADPDSVRKEWTHVIRMLTAGERTGFSEAKSQLEDDVSAENWARFLAARNRVIEEHQAREDDPPAADPSA